MGPRVALSTINEGNATTVDVGTVPRMEELTPATFERHIGSTFTVAHDGQTCGVDLVAVRRHAAQPHASRAEPFSLDFRGSASTPLAQQIHTFDHPQLGPLDIFVVPIGGDGSHIVYEAVFN